MLSWQLTLRKQCRYLLFLLLFVAAFPTAKLLGEDIEPKSPIDGIYVDGGSGEYRIIQFQNGWMTLKTDDGYELRGRYIVRGETQGNLFINYFDGQTRVAFSTTFAICEQKLWLGTLNRLPHQEEESYYYAKMQNAGMFGLSSEHCPAGRFHWYSQKGLGQFYAEGEKRFDFKTHKFKMPGENKFVIGVERESNFTAEESKLLTGKSEQVTSVLPDFLDNHFGWHEVFHETEAITNQMKALYDARKSDEDIEQRFRSRTFRAADKDANVIIAPWSICVGQVGLFPIDLEEAKLVGEWSDGLTVLPKADQSILLSDIPLFPIDPDDDDSALKVLSELRYAPKPAIFNISRQSFSYNCMMGHLDIPGVVLWFPISNSKIARFWSPPTHGQPTKIQLSVHSRIVKSED